MNTKMMLCNVLLVFLMLIIILPPDTCADVIHDHTFWPFETLKCLDPWGDADLSEQDIIAVYFKETDDDYWFRVDLMDMPPAGLFNIYAAINDQPGGTAALIQGNAAVRSDLDWDLLAVLTPQQQTLTDDAFADQSDAFTHFAFDTELDFIEFAISADAFSTGNPSDLNVQVFTFNNRSDTILDQTEVIASSDTTGRAKAVLCFGNTFNATGPSSISWYDGFALDAVHRPGERRGTKYLLDAFEKYQLPLTTIDLRVDVMPANDFLTISDRLKDLNDRQLLDMPESLTYGHFMTWQPDAADRKALQSAREKRTAFGYEPSPVFAPYESQITAGDLDLIKEAGYTAIYAGNIVGYWFGFLGDDDWGNAEIVRNKVESGKKIHQINDMLVFVDPIYWGFQWDRRWGTVVYPPFYDLYQGTDRGLHLWYRRILMDMALDADQEKYLTIGTDLNLTPMAFPDVTEWNARWIACHPWIEAVIFTELIERNWTPVDHGTLNLPAEDRLHQHQFPGDIGYNSYFGQFYYGGTADGHSPVIPEGETIEAYADYIPFLRNGQPIHSGMKMGDAEAEGTIIYEILKNLQAAPDNALTELAWYAYFMNIAEQTLHTADFCEPGTDSQNLGGRYLHPHAKVRANNLRHVNKIITAAQWAEQVKNGELGFQTQCLVQDIDLDGEDEYVLKNDQVFTIFENDNGRLEFAFACNDEYGPVQLIGLQSQIFIPWNTLYADSERPASLFNFILESGFETTTFDEGEYLEFVFSASVENNALKFESPDGNIIKTFTLEENRIHAEIETQNLSHTVVNFGLPVNAGQMFSNRWWANLEKIETGRSAGWRCGTGGTASVEFGNSTLNWVQSFTQSPVQDEMSERDDFTTYPSSHWYPVPCNDVSLIGSGSFELTLTLSADPDDDTDVESNPAIPKDFDLKQNYPNPFNGETTVFFQIPKDSRVIIRVFNIRGEAVRTLSDQVFHPGGHQVIWDGRDDSDKYVTSGVYVIQMISDNFKESCKCLLIE